MYLCVYIYAQKFGKNIRLHWKMLPYQIFLPLSLTSPSILFHQLVCRQGHFGGKEGVWVSMCVMAFVTWELETLLATYNHPEFSKVIIIYFVFTVVYRAYSVYQDKNIIIILKQNKKITGNSQLYPDIRRSSATYRLDSIMTLFS